MSYGLPGLGYELAGLSGLNGSAVLSDSARAVAYDERHVDTDLHQSFPLVRLVPMTPIPLVKVTNTVRVFHTSNGMVQVINPPTYPRVILRGDW